MSSRRSRPILRLAANGLLAVALVACSTTGKGPDRADTTGTTDVQPTVTTTAETGPTTTEADGSTTTTEPTSTDITLADLEALLPSAADLGGTYEIEADDGPDSSDDEVDKALADACPGVTDLMEDDGDSDEEEAAVAFSDTDERRVEVALSPSSDFESEAVDEMVDAINSCDTVAYTDENGLEYAMDLTAERTADFGDASVVMFIDMTIDADELPRPLEISAIFRTFVVGPVSVNLMAMDGLDESTLKPVRTDVELLDGLAEDMEARVTELVDG